MSNSMMGSQYLRDMAMNSDLARDETREGDEEAETATDEVVNGLLHLQRRNNILGGD